MRYLPKAPSLIALAFLAGMAALSACSSDGKTIVALTIKSDDTIKNIDQLVITASAPGHGPVTKMIVPGKDADSGVITASFYERIELDGFSGTATIKVDANSGGSLVATAMTDVEIRANGATAARVSLTTKKPTVDAGAPDTGGSDAGAGDADDSDAQN